MNRSDRHCKNRQITRRLAFALLIWPSLTAGCGSSGSTEPEGVQATVDTAGAGTQPDAAAKDAWPLNQVTDHVNCVQKCKPSGYCMVICASASGSTGKWTPPCADPKWFGDGRQTSDYCWNPPNKWCAGGAGGAVTPACSADGEQCCVFSSTCIRCGWDACDGKSKCGGIAVPTTHPPPPGSPFVTKCPEPSAEWEVSNCAVCGTALVCPDQ